jgi:hypothetical protein
MEVSPVCPAHKGVCSRGAQRTSIRPAGSLFVKRDRSVSSELCTSPVRLRWCHPGCNLFGVFLNLVAPRPLSPLSWYTEGQSIRVSLFSTRFSIGLVLLSDTL